MPAAAIDISDEDISDEDISDEITNVVAAMFNQIAVENVANNNKTALDATTQLVHNLTIEQLDALLMSGTEQPGARI